MLSQVCRQLLTKHATIVQLGRIHTSAVNATFWEREKRAGYTKNPRVTKQMILDGLKELRNEIKIWSAEVKEKFETDPLMAFRPGETDIVWKFSGLFVTWCLSLVLQLNIVVDKEDFDKWVATADSDHNQGKSIAFFEQSRAGNGHFTGELSSELPVDGKIKKAGYCNIKSMRYRKSFKRECYFDWTFYNMLVLKVRGDGRTYLINIATEGYFDNTWNDVYHYALYTRGGPHWQTVKIPFSKFFLASKGRVQDKQFPIPLNRVSSVGFSVSARAGHEGHFSLELDYVGLEFDPSHSEEFAYEMYKQDKYIVNT